MSSGTQYIVFLFVPHYLISIQSCELKGALEAKLNPLILLTHNNNFY